LVNIFKAIMGMCDTSPLADDVWSLMDSQIALDLAKVPALSEKGGAGYMAGKGLAKPVLVVRGQDNNLYAYENACPHGGRKIDPMQGEAKLRCCSVNHSTFDYNGKVLSGPAQHKHELRRLLTSQADGKLLISV